MRHFYVRTIKKGTVQINGEVYRPSEQYLRYDGRLDGLRYMFGIYQGEPFVSLCCIDEADYCLPGQQTPDVVNGKLPWVWWHKEP